MVNKLMYISYDDTQNQPFCRLQLVVDTNQTIEIQWNFPKLLSQRIRKRNNKSLGTSVPSLPGYAS